ncbi:hypothetical protein L202_03833 [Cryptococcus amylolentus CBS 6039]|uniref:MARVEL domain-containing protein n=2 Tax=Cryptococcus amylolentus TaxID=104669 RepID=A0A1E3HUE2_9TREE|nr:hypothetical protein L202_03833 [Cryptococcus amylolentus CBS 6039]ODN79959.1 hypothetical protein L202_03833 [Cryptococcus amylolentus CBS 6039]ODO08203.1 hypothetical protein I350_03792 [Cryptococcus amylolentus CBS 6273]
MGRTVGLPYHLGYPLLSCTLLAVAAFASADSVWYVSVATEDTIVRFASQNYCGYNVSNLEITGKLGCIFRGFQWQIPTGYFGFTVPNDINMNLGRVVVCNVVAFSLVLISGAHHAYTIRYSYRASPAPNADKLYSLAMLHFISVTVCFAFTWIAFIAQAAVIGHSVSQSNSLIDEGGVAVYWGQSAFLVLAAAVVHTGWGYEAVRWRVSLLG